MTHFTCHDDGIHSGFLCIKCGAKSITQVSGHGWVMILGIGFTSKISNAKRWSSQLRSSDTTMMEVKK